MQFSDLSINDHLLERIAQKGFENPTAIQEATIPLSFENKDVIACAKTGSGKTLAFSIPLIQKLLEKIERGEEMGTAPFGLVLAPTRELALQILEEVEYLIEGSPVKAVAIYGGEGYDRQKKALKDGVHILIATPGRLIDYAKSKDLDLSKIGCAVLDEADRMLDMGFIDDVKFILSKTGEEKQVSLFSATLDYNAFYAVYEHMRFPEEVLINPELIDHSKIKQEVLHLGKDEKLAYLITYLQRSESNPVIVFTNTKNFVESIVKNLQKNDIASQGLSSTVSQQKRIRVLNMFKEQKFRVLVATDVASRGLHIEDIDLVINYDVPQDPESYVHRIGRTARAGKSGHSICICSELDYNHLSKIEKYLDYKLPVAPIDETILASLSEIEIIRSDDRRSRDNRGERGRDRNRNDRPRGRDREKKRESRRPQTHSKGDHKERKREREEKPYKKKTHEKQYKTESKEVFQPGEIKPSSGKKFEDFPEYPTAKKKKGGIFKKFFSLFKKKEKAEPKEEQKVRSEKGQKSRRPQQKRYKQSNKNRNNSSSGSKRKPSQKRHNSKSRDKK